MAEKDPLETTDIIVCGCGPTGAMVSVLLSQYSIPHVVLEKDCEVNADPRGIALDEDGIRCLQACGIYDKIFTEIGQCKFVSSSHQLPTSLLTRRLQAWAISGLSARCIMTSVESPS
jgi:2-polyprenyl-6-methoxyphenol hydroxylase-like FAD-dependent oxidoreductase